MDELIFNFKVTHKVATQNPNALGELLRNEFFNQDNGDLGCYSTFDLREDVTGIEEREITEEAGAEWEFKEIWTIAHKIIDGKIVTMRYYWDGDGYLDFTFPGGFVLLNRDCKKTYNWELDSDALS